MEELEKLPDTRKSPKFVIIRQEEFTADDIGIFGEALTHLNGCSDNGKDFGLGFWQYDFDVWVTNQKGDSCQFTVSFQPEERNDQLKNYSGYEVCPAIMFGCDSDQSSDLLKFCDQNTLVLDELSEIAKNKAKTRLAELMGDIQ